MQATLRSYRYNVRKRTSRSPSDKLYHGTGHDEQEEQGLIDPLIAIKTGESNLARREARTLFDKLSIELNQHIAEYIENDDDVESFRETCTATFDAVDADNMTFWRRRFLASFEMPVGVKSNAELKKLYLLRKDVLKRGVGSGGFEMGTKSRERHCLAEMRQMLIEAFSEKTDRNALTYESKNMSFVLSVAKSHGLFQAIFPPRYHEKREQYNWNSDLLRLQQAIQIMLAPCMLSFELDPAVHRFPESQQVVYSTTEANPIFNGTKVNMECILHNLNFWRYHMVREEELTLERVYRSLPDTEKPQFWSNQLCSSTKQEVGRYWKGAYGYVDREDVEYIRDGRGLEEQFQDEFSGDEVGSQFQDLELQLDRNAEDGWSEYFEQHLQSLRPPFEASSARTRAQKRSQPPESMPECQPRSFRFGGHGSDDAEDFTADGWLNPLPDQEGLPGWQRMTMMKYYQDPVTGIIDFNALWAYEGVVLPGSQMMVGRWWSPRAEGEEMYSGPFLLWCVDSAFDSQARHESVEL